LETTNGTTKFSAHFSHVANRGVARGDDVGLVDRGEDDPDDERLLRIACTAHSGVLFRRSAVVLIAT
jgi:hypothetical protein